MSPQSSPQQTPGSALGSQLLPLSKIPLPPAMSTKTWFTNNYQGSRSDPLSQVCFGLKVLLSFTCNQLTSDLQTSPFPHTSPRSKPLRIAVALEQSPLVMFYLL